MWLQLLSKLKFMAVTRRNWCNSLHFSIHRGNGWYIFDCVVPIIMDKPCFLVSRWYKHQTKTHSFVLMASPWWWMPLESIMTLSMVRTCQIVVCIMQLNNFFSICPCNEIKNPIFPWPNFSFTCHTWRHERVKVLMRNITAYASHVQNIKWLLKIKIDHDIMLTINQNAKISF